MRSLVIKTKFIPPTSPDFLWKNKSLLTKYNKIKDYPLTVIKAGPGFGKSTTLASFFKENYNNNSYWYSIDELDTDSTLFFLNMIHAIKYEDNSIGQESLKLLNQSRDVGRPLREVIDTLINELFNQLKEDSFLILDDFHLVNNNDKILKHLEYFISRIPPQLHLVIATREKINFKKWPTWRLKKKVFVVEEDEFSLNNKDIKDFLQFEYDLDLTDNQVKKLQKETEGWIMALDLIGEGLKNGSSIDDILANETESLKLLFQYLAYEVVENQTDEIKEFLLKTSVLKYLGVEICNKLLDIENSSEILEKLSTRRLFVYSLSNNQYRYHHLFHEYLKNQCQKKFNHKNLHKKTAEICLELGKRGFAIYHSLRAEDYDKAARLILSSAEKLLELGRIETLQDGLNYLPDELFSRYPSLYLYQGDICRLRSHFNQALEVYKKAEEHFKKTNDKLKLSQVLQKIAMIYLDTVQPVQADQYLKKALKIRDEENLWEEATLLKMLAENKANEGDLKEAEKLQNQAEDITDDDVTHNNFSARVKLRTGRLDKGQQILEEKLDKERNIDRIPRSHRETILILSLIHSLKGEQTLASNYAQGGVYLGQKFNSPFIEAVSYMRLGHAYQLGGRHKMEKARDAYHQAMEIVDRLKIPRGRAEPLMGLTLLEAFYGDTNLGIKYSREGLKISHQAGDEWLSGLLNIGRGVNLFFADKLEMAERVFLENVNNFVNLNDRFCHTICKTWLSLIYYHQQKWEKFSRTAEEMLLLAKKNNFDSIFLKSTLLGSDNINLFAPLLLEARDRNIYNNYVSGLLAELGLSNLDSHPGYYLRIKSFGNLRVWRGKDEISSKEWEREKAKELFLLFLIHRGELIPKEKIYYYLWPEKDEDTASRNFKVTLNALKNALEPERKPRQKPFFINRRGSSYGFNQNAGYVFDVEEFEQLISRGDRVENKQERINYYQTAVNLYDDDFIIDKLYIDWIRNERERLRNKYLNTADKLMTDYFKQNSCEQCIEICNDILQIDNCWEKAYLYKMKCYDKLDRRSMALKVYKKCNQVLDRELNVFPIPEIENYYKKLI